MRYLAAYLLATLGGNESPSKSDITAILEAVGIESDETQLESVLSNLSGKNVDELVKEGSSKLASVPSGGAAPAASAAAGGAAEAKKEEKVEEPEEEEEEEADFDLFD